MNEIEYWLKTLPEAGELFNIEKIKPIFIVGVPRCGSTLIEKVIASGPTLIPIGEETNTINFFVGKIIIEKKSINLNIEKIKKDIVSRYKEKGLLKKENDYIFTDKSLENFFYIDFIKEIFPHAKVINCRRNPLASIMSILQNKLPNVAWAHDIQHIFKYFDIYYKTIANYKKTLSHFIYDLDYEKFVEDPEIESKKLMKFCGLPWNKTCLEFYKRKDLFSKTSSRFQIRKPIYKDSLNKYLPHKAFLDHYGTKYFWYN
jgi:hypothetical protein